MNQSPNSYSSNFEYFSHKKKTMDLEEQILRLRRSMVTAVPLPPAATTRLAPNAAHLNSFGACELPQEKQLAGANDLASHEDPIHEANRPPKSDPYIESSTTSVPKLTKSPSEDQCDSSLSLLAGKVRQNPGSKPGDNADPKNGNKKMHALESNWSDRMTAEKPEVELGRTQFPDDLPPLRIAPRPNQVQGQVRCSALPTKARVFGLFLMSVSILFFILGALSLFNHRKQVDEAKLRVEGNSSKGRSIL